MSDLRFVPRVVSGYMQAIRDEANWCRTHPYPDSPNEFRKNSDRSFLDGMEYAALYWACPWDEHYDTAKDAFTAAQNELNFLYGRYQENVGAADPSMVLLARWINRGATP